MMTTERMSDVESNDAELVAGSLAGQRDSFRQIVERYQSVICALAYSATGSLSQSEDLAQEVFVTAWTQMSELRESVKLRAWLCGIARKLIGKALRRDGREPACAVEPSESRVEPHSPQPLLAEHAISREEEAILWRALEGIPEAYREPLVLFYRENQSVVSVAEALDLSEEAVKQRLSRGRGLLQEQVLAFVEGALKRTSPGQAFTLGVLAALPAFSASARAATVVATAAKGSVTAASATFVTVLNSLLGPVLGIIGACIGVRGSLDATCAPRERTYAVRQARIGLAIALASNLVLGVYILAALKYWSAYPVLVAAFGIGIPLLFAGSILFMAFRCNRGLRHIHEVERLSLLGSFEEGTSAAVGIFKEYRSHSTLFGLPLLHVRTGARLGEKTQPAVGWIAIGDRAFGILFAAGGVAVGAVSVGGAALGLVAVGGVCAGLVALGGLALGGVALGGGAIGIVAAGGMATAWIGAEGGLAVAHEFALGGLALAQHANDAAAREFFAHYRWIDMTREGNRTWFAALCWLPLVLVIWQAWRVRRSQRKPNGSVEKSM